MHGYQEDNLTGFYSDKTAEYALVPKFVELLAPLGIVVPIAFSGRRENTLLGLESMTGESFRLVAFFARRPKIDKVGSRRIHGTIYERFFWVSHQAALMGVPTFCGISLTNNIFDQARAQSLWFDITELPRREDQNFICDVNENLQLERFCGQIQPAERATIQARVLEGLTFDWKEATDIMATLPGIADMYPQPRFGFHSHNWRLRPVYFAIRIT